MSEEKPLVYLILGAAGSGRRTVLLDLIADGLPPDAQPVVLISEDEATSPLEDKFPLVESWVWTGSTIEADLPASATHVFLLSDGTKNPVDQVEALKPWLIEQNVELARVVTVVNCQLAEAHSVCNSATSSS